MSCHPFVVKMESLSTFSNLESLLLLRHVELHGFNVSSLRRASSDLKKLSFIHRSYDDRKNLKYTPETLTILLQKLLKENSLNEVIGASKKRKATDSSDLSSHFSSKNNRFMSQIISELYANYRKEMVSDLKGNEAKYIDLMKQVDLAEQGYYDNQLQPQYKLGESEIAANAIQLKSVDRATQLSNLTPSIRSLGMFEESINNEITHNTLETSLKDANLKYQWINEPKDTDLPVNNNLYNSQFEQQQLSKRIGEDNSTRLSNGTSRIVESSLPSSTYAYEDSISKAKDIHETPPDCSVQIRPSRSIDKVCATSPEKETHESHTTSIHKEKRQQSRPSINTMRSSSPQDPSDVTQMSIKEHAQVQYPLKSHKSHIVGGANEFCEDSRNHDVSLPNDAQPAKSITGENIVQYFDLGKHNYNEKSVRQIPPESDSYNLLLSNNSEIASDQQGPSPSTPSRTLNASGSHEYQSDKDSPTLSTNEGCGSDGRTLGQSHEPSSVTRWRHVKHLSAASTQPLPRPRSFSPISDQEKTSGSSERVQKSKGRRARTLPRRMLTTNENQADELDVHRTRSGLRRNARPRTSSVTSSTANRSVKAEKRTPSVMSHNDTTSVDDSTIGGRDMNPEPSTPVAAESPSSQQRDSPELPRTRSRRNAPQPLKVSSSVSTRSRRSLRQTSVPNSTISSVGVPNYEYVQASETFPWTFAPLMYEILLHKLASLFSRSSKRRTPKVTAS